MIRIAFVAMLAVAAMAGPAHSLDFWKQIARDKYAVPADSNLGELTAELTDMLASPDPELRDDIAYSTLAAWIYQTRVLDGAALRTLIASLLGNLTAGIGERGTDGVFRRSFSALTLSAVVARDNAAPFLTAEEFRRIEQAALAYLRTEQDLRGYDPEHGWMHSAAHTADLLKFIGRSRFLSRPINRRCSTPSSRNSPARRWFSPTARTSASRAPVTLDRQPSRFRSRAFSSWTVRTKPPRPGAKPTVAELAHAQNVKNLLAKSTSCWMRSGNRPKPCARHTRACAPRSRMRFDERQPTSGAGATIDLPDLQPERDDDQQDGAERDREAAAPEPELGDAVLAGASTPATIFVPSAMIGVDERRVERVHLGARQRQLGGAPRAAPAPGRRPRCRVLARGAISARDCSMPAFSCSMPRAHRLGGRRALVVLVAACGRCAQIAVCR